MSKNQAVTVRGLPWQPESIEKIQARFAASLDPLYVVHSEDEARATQVGRQRKHVFDLENGFRVICSLESYRTVQQPNIHMSFSTTLPEEQRRGMNGKQIIDYFNQLAMEMSRGRLVLAQVKVTDGGVVHIFYEGTSFVAKLDEAERKVLSAWLGRGRAA